MDPQLKAIRRIEQVRAATEQAEALLAVVPDDAGAMSEAALRQVQAKIFEMMLHAEGGKLKELAACARALADIVRAWLAVRQDRRKVLAEAEADETTDPKAMLRRVREDIYGIFDQ